MSKILSRNATSETYRNLFVKLGIPVQQIHSLEEFDEGFTPALTILFRKPITLCVNDRYEAEPTQAAIDEIREKGWGGELLLVSDSDTFDEYNFGRFVDGYGDGAWLFYCDHCRCVSITSAIGKWECRRCGYYDGDHHIGDISKNVGVLYNRFRSAL